MGSGCHFNYEEIPGKCYCNFTYLGSYTLTFELTDEEKKELKKVSDNTFYGIGEQLRKELKKIADELIKTLKIDKFLNWLSNKLT